LDQALRRNAQLESENLFLQVKSNTLQTMKRMAEHSAEHANQQVKDLTEELGDALSYADAEAAQPTGVIPPGLSMRPVSRDGMTFYVVRAKGGTRLRLAWCLSQAEAEEAARELAAGRSWLSSKRRRLANLKQYGSSSSGSTRTGPTTGSTGATTDSASTGSTGAVTDSTSAGLPTLPLGFGPKPKRRAMKKVVKVSPDLDSDVDM